MRWRPRLKDRTERGAAAVEFALIVPILFILLFGIIDYGILFTDSVSTRNGVREAARQGVVSNFDGTSLSDLREYTKDEIGALSAPPSVKVYVEGGSWKDGAKLVVCARIADPGIINLVPVPGEVRSRVEMSIETESLPPTGSLASADAGTWGSWC